MKSRETKPIKEKGKHTGSMKRDVVIDSGVADKRLLVIEANLPKCLRS